jgi:hypothetical protein
MLDLFTASLKPYIASMLKPNYLQLDKALLFQPLELN